MSFLVFLKPVHQVKNIKKDNSNHKESDYFSTFSLKAWPNFK